MSDEVHGVERRTKAEEQPEQPEADAEERYLRMGDAARALGVSRMKMWTLVQSGEVSTRKDLLDRRVTLVPMRDIERLLRKDLRARRVAVA